MLKTSGRPPATAAFPEGPLDVFALRPVVATIAGTPRPVGPIPGTGYIFEVAVSLTSRTGVVPVPDDDAEVPLTSQNTKDEEWADQVRMHLNDPTLCRGPGELRSWERPKLAATITLSARAAFETALKDLCPTIPLSKVNHLIEVLGAANLLQEIQLDAMSTMHLPVTGRLAFIASLTHIKRFSPKAPFGNSPNFSFAMVHGTTIMSAKMALAEGLVRPADWTYKEPLKHCELPSCGCDSIGAEMQSREPQIPERLLRDLLDRASKRGKGQLEVLLMVVYCGCGPNLKLLARGNDMVQTRAASHSWRRQFWGEENCR
eukprot:s211_g10.t1